MEEKTASNQTKLEYEEKDLEETKSRIKKLKQKIVQLKKVHGKFLKDINDKKSKEERDRLKKEVLEEKQRLLNLHKEIQEAKRIVLAMETPIVAVYHKKTAGQKKASHKWHILSRLGRFLEDFFLDFKNDQALAQLIITATV